MRDSDITYMHPKGTSFGAPVLIFSQSSESRKLAYLILNR